MERVFVPWTLAETFLSLLFFWIVRMILNISVDGRRGSLRSEEETLFFLKMGHCLFKKISPGKQLLLKLSSPNDR